MISYFLEINSATMNISLTIFVRLQYEPIECASSTDNQRGASPLALLIFGYIAVRHVANLDRAVK